MKDIILFLFYVPVAIIALIIIVFSHGFNAVAIENEIHKLHGVIETDFIMNWGIKILSAIFWSFIIYVIAV